MLKTTSILVEPRKRLRYRRGRVRIKSLQQTRTSWVFILSAQFCFSQNYILQAVSGCTGATCSAVYQNINGYIGIGNTSPAAALDLTGPTGAAGAVILKTDYNLTGPTGVTGTTGYPNYMQAIGTRNGTTNTDFLVNPYGQVSIGNGYNIGWDLTIQNHGFLPTADIGNPFMVVADDNFNFLFLATNTGSSSTPSGALLIGSNYTSASSGPPTAFEITDLSGTLKNPVFAVGGDGVVGVGTSNPLAQLDVNAQPSYGDIETNPLDYLFHAGNHNTVTLDGTPVTTSEDYFAISNAGYVGVGQLNAGNSLVEISDVNGVGAAGTPLLLIDNGTPGDPYFMVRGSSSGVHAGVGIDPLAYGGSSTLALQGVGGTLLNILDGSGSGTGGIVFESASGVADHYIVNSSSSTLTITPGFAAGTSAELEIDGNQKVDFNEHVAGDEQVDGNATVSGNELVSGTVTIGANTAPTGLGSGTFSSALLSVDGQIAAKEVVVTTSGWEDTVFSNTYKLRPLIDLANYVQQNHHLPEVPSEAEVMKNGVSLCEMNKLLLQKVEELTLYVMSQQKEIEILKKMQEK